MAIKIRERSDRDLKAIAKALGKYAPRRTCTPRSKPIARTPSRCASASWTRTSPGRIKRKETTKFCGCWKNCVTKCKARSRFFYF